MKKVTLLCLSLLLSLPIIQAQTNPAITSWLQNDLETGTYYVEGNSSTIDNNILYNCQSVCYDNNFAWITTEGIPAYPTGPFLDNNPSLATAQDDIFRFPLNPQEETGTKTATTAGTIGVFINGVSLFDYQDGVSWDASTNQPCGGPGNSPCTGSQDWNRDAIPAEMEGFDCSKGHPAMGNYHHHQNPSAFKWDQVVVSDICNLYDADGLYAIDDTQHSPLIGFAYDGFPIYGAYGYTNADGTGGITRIKSGYQLRNITQRTHHADGTDVTDGPAVNTTYFLGYYREDYEWVAHPSDEDYLDEHNGRFCVTPEYPNGIYAYFATVDADWNSAYPYAVGPTFYGEYANRSVNGMSPNCVDYIAPLPVELLHFNATLVDNFALLSWETATEVNNAFFTIERSFDGNTFEKIAVIEGGGNVSDRQLYSHKDDLTALNGVIYYRLKQTDYDGTEEIGKVVALEVNRKSAIEIRAFPNPCTDFVAVQIPGLNTQTVQIKLLDMKGQLVLKGQITAGSSLGYITTNTLYNGEYILLVNDGIQTTSQKIVVMHD